MTTKKELIEERLNKMEKYATSQKFPFHDKIEETRKKYNTELIVGLIERFLIPAYDEKVLKEYLLTELERYKLIAVAQGEDAKLLDFSLNDEQMKRIVKDLSYIIKVIKI
jgi:hypothetical protein